MNDDWAKTEINLDKKNFFSSLFFSLLESVRWCSVIILLAAASRDSLQVRHQ